MTMRDGTALDASSAAGSGIRIVLFDVGGVLVEVTGIGAILEWVEHRLTPEDIWRLWFRSPAVRAFETGRIEPARFASELLAELDLELSAEGFLEAFVTWPARLYPGVMELLARIPPRYTRALLSNSNALHWPRVMNDLGLGAAFEHHFVSHLIGWVKPDPEAFRHALEGLRCAPSEVFFLDDNAVNVAAARRLGMRAAQVRGAAEAERALVLAGVLHERTISPP
jgi:glucose-1-phosphatase